MVTITLSGPSNVWFGVGFNALEMADTPYTIIVDGNGNVTERNLADHAPGTLLPKTIKVLTDTVLNGVRTVVLTRTAQAASANYYNFSLATQQLSFLSAVGSTPDLQYHSNRTVAVLYMFQPNVVSCLCNDKTGSINGVPYTGDCRPLPLSDLGALNNPTCDVSTYVGGQSCCAHGTFLLDSDQTVPETVDEVFFKWRFYFEEYDPTVHTTTFHLEWAVNGCDSGGAANGQHNCRNIEYDVVQAPPGTPPSETVYQVTSHFTASNMFSYNCSVSTDTQCADSSLVTSAGFVLVMAGGHCHTPTCIRQELWDADTDTLLCVMTPVSGTGDDVYNEAGYLWTPPCLWGTLEEGLLPPPILHLDTNLTLISYSNNTYAHYGNMGIWQMRGALQL